MLWTVHQYGRAVRLLGNLFLLISTTKMVVRAQEVTIQMERDTSQDKMIAQMLGNVFTGIAQDVEKIQGAAAGHTNSSEISNRGSSTSSSGSNSGNSSSDTPHQTSGRPVFNMTQLPNLMRVLNLTAATSGPEVADALKNMLAQQQQSGGGVSGLEGAASTVAAFLNLPNTIGTGQNINLFLTRVQELKQLRDRVKSYLNADQLRTLASSILSAEQLGLQAATIPLAYLAFLIALIALAAAILGLLGGIFYTVGSAVAISAVLAGAPTLAQAQAGQGTAMTDDVEELAAAAVASARSSANQPADNVRSKGVEGTYPGPLQPEDEGVRGEQWFKNLTDKAYKVQEPFLQLAFSTRSGYPIETAITMLDWAGSGLDMLRSVSQRFSGDTATN